MNVQLQKHSQDLPSSSALAARLQLLEVKKAVKEGPSLPSSWALLRKDRISAFVIQASSGSWDTWLCYYSALLSWGSSPFPALSVQLLWGGWAVPKCSFGQLVLFSVRNSQLGCCPGRNELKSEVRTSFVFPSPALKGSSRDVLGVTHPGTALHSYLQLLANCILNEAFPSLEVPELKLHVPQCW